MRISKRDLKFLLALVGLLAFLALYFLVAQRYQSKTDSVRASVSVLEPQVAELEGYHQNLTTYEQGILNYQQSISDGLKAYPARMENEDFLVYLLDMESRTGLTMRSVSFDAPTVLLQFPCEVVHDGQTVTADVTAYRIGTVMTGELNYPQLKNAIEHLYDSRQRTALDSLSVSYNAETGGLTATFSVAKYLLDWDGAPYSPAAMPRTSLSTSDLFGTT